MKAGCDWKGMDMALPSRSPFPSNLGFLLFSPIVLYRVISIHHRHSGLVIPVQPIQKPVRLANWQTGGAKDGSPARQRQAAVR